jgi:hypothetical protein
VLCCGNLSNFEVCFRVNTLIKNSVVFLFVVTRDS